MTFSIKFSLFNFPDLIPNTIIIHEDLKNMLPTIDNKPFKLNLKLKNLINVKTFVRIFKLIHLIFHRSYYKNVLTFSFYNNLIRTNYSGRGVTHDITLGRIRTERSRQ